MLGNIERLFWVFLFLLVGVLTQLEFWGTAASTICVTIKRVYRYEDFAKVDPCQDWLYGLVNVDNNYFATEAGFVARLVCL